MLSVLNSKSWLANVPTKPLTKSSVPTITSIPSSATESAALGSSVPTPNLSLFASKYTYWLMLTLPSTIRPLSLPTSRKLLFVTLLPSSCSASTALPLIARCLPRPISIVSDEKKNRLTIKDKID